MLCFASLNVTSSTKDNKSHWII